MGAGNAQWQGPVAVHWGAAVRLMSLKQLPFAPACEQPSHQLTLVECEQSLRYADAAPVIGR
jgi:hypothetical protein